MSRAAALALEPARQPGQARLGPARAAQAVQMRQQSSPAQAELPRPPARLQLGEAAARERAQEPVRAQVGALAVPALEPEPARAVPLLAAAPKPSPASWQRPRRPATSNKTASIASISSARSARVYPHSRAGPMPKRVPT